MYAADEYMCVDFIYANKSFSSSIFHSFFIVATLSREATITHFHILVSVSFALELCARQTISHTDLIRPYIFNKMWPV